MENQICYVTRVYLKVNYSVMKTFDEGKFLPILYGAISSNKEATFTPVLIDDTVEKGKFGLADKSVQRIKSVDAVKYEGDTLTPTTHYTVDEINCTILIKTAYPKTIDDPSALKVYLKGAQINDIPGESSIEHITSASNILRHLFSRVLEWDISKIDDNSFDTAATDAPQECRLFITDETYAADMIALICQSVRGVFSQDRDGKLYFNIWSEDDTGALELQDEDILALNVNERNIMPAYRVVVKYGRDPDSGDWLLEKAEDVSAKYKFKQVETKTFETLLVNKSDAHDLASELLDAYKEPIKEIEVLVKLQASKLKVGDKIKITRSRAPNSDGNWSAETFQVKTVTKEGGFKTRLTLEPNKYLSASTVSTDEKMEYDDKEAISRAIACLTTNAYSFKSDKTIEGRSEAIGTTVTKIKSDGDFKGDIYDSGGTTKLLDAVNSQLTTNIKVEGRSEALFTTISKIKTDGHFKGDLYASDGTTQLLNVTSMQITDNLLDSEGEIANTGIRRGRHGFQDEAGKLVVGAKDSSDRNIQVHINYVSNNLDLYGLKAGRKVGANLTTTNLDAVIDSTGKIKPSAYIDDTDADAIAAGANRSLAAIDYDSGNRTFKGCLQADGTGRTGIRLGGATYELSIYNDGTRKYLIVGSSGGGGGTGEEEGGEIPEV